MVLGVGMPIFFGFPKTLLDFQLEMSERHGGVWADLLSGLSRKLVCSFVTWNPRMSFDPSDVCRSGP
jgi:hypothetical protein